MVLGNEVRVYVFTHKIRNRSISVTATSLSDAMERAGLSKAELSEYEYTSHYTTRIDVTRRQDDWLY